jgi:hypothetical protein
MQKSNNFMWIMFTSRRSVMTYLRHEVSPLLSFLIIFIYVPPTLMHGFRKTASQIAMKVRVYNYNYISEIR